MKLALGYSLDLNDPDGGSIHFPLASRSPSEGYLTDNYAAYVICHYTMRFTKYDYRPVHTDKTFCKFTLAWNTSYDPINCQAIKYKPGKINGWQFCRCISESCCFK